MKKYYTIATGIELPLGLHGECNVAITYSLDKGEKETRHSPEVKPHIVIEGVEVTGITVEDHNCVAIELPPEVLKDDILPIIEEHLQNNEEELLQELAEELYTEPY